MADEEREDESLDLAARLDQLEMRLAELGAAEEPMVGEDPDRDAFNDADVDRVLWPDYLDAGDTVRSLELNSTGRLGIYGFEQHSPMAPSAGSEVLFVDESGGVASVAYAALTEVTVQTDSRYDTATHQLQKKTRTVLVLGAGSETDWTMIDGGQAEGCTTPLVAKRFGDLSPDDIVMVQET
jgi:hypothetical protein